MWIFTTYGFFSVVNKTDPSRYDEDIEASEEEMEVRSRYREHLELLIERFPEQIGDEKILAYDDPGFQPGTDYEYRIKINAEQWIHLAAMLAADVTYPNFKSEVQECVLETQLKNTPYLDQCYDVYTAVSMSNRWNKSGHSIN